MQRWLCILVNMFTPHQHVFILILFKSPSYFYATSGEYVIVSVS